MIDQTSFDEVHERVFAALADPGDWLEAAERRELMRAVRASAESPTPSGISRGGLPGRGSRGSAG